MTKQPVALLSGKHYLVRGSQLIADGPSAAEQLASLGFGPEQVMASAQGSIASRILRAHDHGNDAELYRLRFDALVSPDNNYVSILQTVRAAGIERYPMPYTLTNCHNSYCAVSGTTNEDDHVFGLGCAKKYGGLFVPRYCAVLHQYMRETTAGCGKMILGSDSHTRYGALGTLGIGEGGGEVAKQLMGITYDLRPPKIIAVYVTGAAAPGVGPHDIALALIAAANGFVKNTILEFVGDGIFSMSMDTRLGVDAMTTEAGGLSSIWQTDEAVRRYLALHGRESDYAPLSPDDLACYDGVVMLDLSLVEPMIALPFHPSCAYPIRQLNEDPSILEAIDEAGRKLYGDTFSISSHLKDGRLYIDQALISGCTGGLFENICAARDILAGCVTAPDAPMLAINPASMQIASALSTSGVTGDLLASGVTMYPPGCGSCFGVTDIPASGQLSARHVTRNFAGREGAVKSQRQHAMVALMDARSLAATVRNGGRLTAATELDVRYTSVEYHYDPAFYERRVYNGFGHPQPDAQVVLGPGISNWPEFSTMPEHMVLSVTGVYKGAITTDDLVPSGEASSLRSNPMRLATYTLSGRDKDFVARSQTLCSMIEGKTEHTDAIKAAYAYLQEHTPAENIGLLGLLCADELGEGSSREQAASCQRILGGGANLALEYPTKRYRTNCINWGILPLSVGSMPDLQPGDVMLLPNIRKQLIEGAVGGEALLLRGGSWASLPVTWGTMTKDELRILMRGCIINDFCGKE